MKHPKNISIADYSYDLPEHRIAEFPLAERDASKLLVYQNEHIREDIYKNLSATIPEGSLLVFNNTKVVEARLLFQKPTGGVIEIFCLEPHEQYPDITTAMSTTGKVWWQCLVGGASKWKKGQVLEKKIIQGNDTIILQASYIEKRTGSFIIELSWTPDTLSFAEMLHLSGAIPLPPYIKRTAVAADAERYQTVYAQHDGSVAAPTAGLHFTKDVFASLAAKNISTDFVTLHVGAGTFKPVKSETLQDHEMHAEYIDVSLSLIKKVMQHSGTSIVAVGTTSLRTLESLYWIGCKAAEGTFSPAELLVKQWDPYESACKQVTMKEALQHLIIYMETHKMERLIGKTQILITPGYVFKVISGLITNFHQPQSTLLLLVAALVGEKWKSIYEHALNHDFRFLSYGDGCLLWK
ncbi:MAG: S-adenosylmethionine:tRNA ribosyltransferase-isomerase [Bacteroidetes bacterium]|nr:S-adenosylmethionine:tRNA ribosyltransferase-isomerase [Bacteroidota bacterium]